MLIDFGIAREFSPNLTQTHTQLLSDGFAPIEQYEWRTKRGAYTDVYALAATLYSLLTGKVPTPAPLRAMGTLLESPKQVNPRISERVNWAILKGMEVKPDYFPVKTSARLINSGYDTAWGALALASKSKFGTVSTEIGIDLESELAGVSINHG